MILLTKKECALLGEGVGVEVIKRYKHGETERALVRPVGCNKTFVHVDFSELGKEWKNVL